MCSCFVNGFLAGQWFWVLVSQAPSLQACWVQACFCAPLAMGRKRAGASVRENQRKKVEHLGASSKAPAPPPPVASATAKAPAPQPTAIPKYTLEQIYAALRCPCGRQADGRVVLSRFLAGDVLGCVGAWLTFLAHDRRRLAFQ